MSLLEVKIPPMGESIASGILAKWHVKDGDIVKKDQPLFELETDKITSEGTAESAGKIAFKAAAGDEVKIGQVVATIDSAASSSPGGPVAASASEPKSAPGTRQTRKKKTPLRAKIAQRLVSAQHEAAMLTTFNEVDMSAVMALRAKYQDDFVKKHGLKLGFMSFFVKAVVHALKEVPGVNAQIDGDAIVENHYYDIGVAVSTDKGLMVPVIKGCDTLGMAAVEAKIADAAKRARESKITLADLEGGVFTITNGGTFGSLLSTPIINPPQAAILGMHAINDRPVAVNGQVVIRPMMYLALSYDHRLVDGKQAVTFLVKVKQAIEDPTRLVLGV